MTKEDFSKQYKDPRWQKKRLEIMQRDEFMCSDCAANDKTLNVHHKYYIPDKKPWDYDNQLLITLCEDCHLEWENNKFIITDFTKVLLADGWTPFVLVQLHELLRKLSPGDISMSYIHEAVKQYELDTESWLNDLPTPTSTRNLL
jgi:hypothetical protein